jgi:hypothetical protein
LPSYKATPLSNLAFFPPSQFWHFL